MHAYLMSVDLVVCKFTRMDTRYLWHGVIFMTLSSVAHRDVKRCFAAGLIVAEHVTVAANCWSRSREELLRVTVNYPRYT